jgi:hypothetical protein
VEPFEHGVAYFGEEFASRYISNFIMVDRSTDGVPAAAFLADAERVPGGAGFAHRCAVTRDGRAGERFVPAFIDAGYAVERNRVMVHGWPPDSEPDLDVHEAGSTTCARSCSRSRREPNVPEGLTRTSTDQHGKFERSVVTRAIDEAHRAGTDRVLIVADADGWPKALYARLGFDAIGGSCVFTGRLRSTRRRRP